MQNRVKTLIPKDFPTLGDILKAEDYWAGVGRSDLAQKRAEIVTEFRAHHEGKRNWYSSWPGAWKTWYVKSVRLIPAPRKAFSAPTRRGPAFKASDVQDDGPMVSIDRVRELAAQLKARIA